MHDSQDQNGKDVKVNLSIWDTGTYSNNLKLTLITFINLLDLFLDFYSNLISFTPLDVIIRYLLLILTF
jgi:hypothetical protein